MFTDTSYPAEPQIFENKWLWRQVTCLLHRHAPLINPLYAPAEVKQLLANTTPLLTAGHLSIQVLQVFETACRCYFTHKKIAAVDQVNKVLCNFKAASVQSWVNVDEERLLELTFKEFLMEFRGKFLVCSWEDKLVQDQISLQAKQTLPYLG